MAHSRGSLGTADGAGGWGRQRSARRFATISLNGGALAADLPLKAPPKPADFIPFWAEARLSRLERDAATSCPALVDHQSGRHAAGRGRCARPAGDDRAVRQLQRQQRTGALAAGSPPATGSIRSAEAASRRRSSGSRTSRTGFATDTNAFPILARPFNQRADGTSRRIIRRISGARHRQRQRASETSRLLGAGALYRWDLGAVERTSASAR